MSAAEQDYALLLDAVEQLGALGSGQRAAWDLLAGRTLLEQGRLEDSSRLLSSAAARLTSHTDRTVLVTALLQLARAWSFEHDGAAYSERVLRLAAETAPELGVPALAQFLERQGRIPEAIEQWECAVRLVPQQTAPYLNLARLHMKAADSGAALRTVLALVSSAPSRSNYLVAAQRLDEMAPLLPPATSAQAIRIALLGNATLDHLQAFIKVECFRAGLRPDIYQSGFDQYTRDIVDPGSELYAFGADVVICAVHPSRLFPRLHEYPYDLTVNEREAEMAAGLNTVQTLLDHLTARSTAMVLLNNMPVPQHPALGIQDSRDELGQVELFRRIDGRLAELVRTRYTNVYLVDEDAVQARSGKRSATDQRLWFSARMPWGDRVLGDLAREYLRYIKPLKGLSRKCIVLDLDNTLWGGVIGEDGIAGLQLGAEAPGNAFVAFQQALHRLWRRGILLAIASKNNIDDVLPVFDDHPATVLTVEHFAALRINWASKAENIREIARELNIGLESLVFIDDNPVERARIRAELPQVLTPEWPVDPALYRQALLELDVFETLSLTDEDRRRNQAYAEQRERRELEATLLSSGGSIEDFLAELETVVEIEPLSDRTLPRAAQLTNKTNQFNLTTRRYSEAQLGQMQSTGSQIYTVRVLDRFGDNGVVGLVILAPVSSDDGEIDTFLLSCRVIGRGVETALLSFLMQRARVDGMRRLRGLYIPTEKNSPASTLYSDHGFERLSCDPSSCQLWEFDLDSPPVSMPAWLTIRVPETVA